MSKLPRPLMMLATTGAIATLALAGCSSDDAGSVENVQDAHSKHDSHDMEGHNHAADGGPAPEGMVPAANAKFPVGTEVQVNADHMPGMKGADAKVVGVFNTTTYSVSYTPTDGSEPVTDHRWVVQEELDNPGPAPLADGTEITINADHMPGMKGAKGTVDYSTQEPVYMVDIDDDGMMQKNHKWVTESELQAES